MRTTVRIIFDGDRLPGDAGAVLAAIGCSSVAEIEWSEALKTLFVRVVLDSTDRRLSELTHLLQANSITWNELVRDVYSSEEILGARLVLLHPNRECEVDGGPEFGTSYNLSGACSRCGTGARQTSALVVGGEEVTNLHDAIAAETYYGDLLIRDTVASALEDAGVTGLELHRVYHSTDSGQRRLPWFNILARRTLPRMSPLTRGIIRGRICRICERQAHCATQKAPMRIVYGEEDLSDAQDVNATWEWFGYTKDDLPYPEGFVARPGILVSPKVVKILTDHGVTAFDFIPIRVETDQSKPQQ